MCSILLFSQHPSTTVIYTLSLHDALPIFAFFYPEEGIEISNTTLRFPSLSSVFTVPTKEKGEDPEAAIQDRKSTRLNSSHVRISYAVFCLKKKIMLVCTWRAMLLFALIAM